MTSDTTALDRVAPIAGLWATGWPAECGGPRRQKAAPGGLRLTDGEHLVTTTRRTDQWNVMLVSRDPGELYLQGNNHLGDEALGWVERVHPTTLETLVRSPDLPAGGHTWCGAALVTDRGDLLVVNGRFLHRLDPVTLEVTAALELAADAPHNGLVPLHDGAYATKDLRLDRPSTLVVVDRDLAVLASVVLPEPSMGRIAADHLPGGTDIYVPGDEHVLRYRWQDGQLVADEGWRPRYRQPGAGGLAWDMCLASGRAWLLDGGDIPAVRHIHGSHPTGTTPLPDGLDGLWDQPLTVTGVALDDDADLLSLTPFPDAASGWVIAPPTVEPSSGLLLVHDTGNARLSAYSTASLEKRWDAPLWMWMQPLLFPEAGELVVDSLGPDGDELVVLDVASGAVLARALTGAERPNGMFLTPGWARDVYYATFDVVARIAVEAG